MRNLYKFPTMLAAGIGAAGIANVALAQDQGPVVTNDASVQSEQLSASSTQHTIYASPADRAKDALIITEVKSTLADDGVTDDYPVTVGAAHGVVTLTGVLASQQDIDHAIVLARNCDGVKSVQNKLTVEKLPAGEQ
ncbi:MAG TPA: BON domain-containing protein [Candidatus Binataceae bacterium]|nr:BON domain-containing protein [Candidatus Binataceae bacterium]